MKSAITIFAIGCLIFTGNLLSADENAAPTSTKGASFNEAATKLLIAQALRGTITPESLKKLKEKNANIDAKYVRDGIETNLFLESVCFSDVIKKGLKNQAMVMSTFGQADTMDVEKELENRVKVLTTLIDLGADTNVTDGNGMNALSLAICKIPNDDLREIIVKILLHKKAHVDINKANNEGVTPLMFAIFCTSRNGGFAPEQDGEVPALVTYLVNAGADVNAVNKKGATPLMGAAACNTLKTVQYLIQHGAKVTAKDKKGMTASDYAKARVSGKKILEYLEEIMLESL